MGDVRLRLAGLLGLVMLVVGLATAQAADSLGWTLQRMPTPVVGQGGLASVSCTSPSSCIAVGRAYHGPLVERWDGRHWRLQRQPAAAETRGIGPAFLAGVSCPSATDCMAVGASHKAWAMIERWNGRRWKIQPGAAPVADPGADHQSHLYGVSCATPGFCAAVGEVDFPFVPAIERWNGTSWTADTVPHAYGTLTSVSCPSPSLCVAVGNGAVSAGAFQQPLVARWDGHSWTATTFSSFQDGSLTGVSCASVTACTAVGTTGEGPLIEHWDGGSWQQESVPQLPDDPVLTGVSCATPTVCTAVGLSDASTITQNTLVLQSDDAGWSVSPAPPAFTGADDAMLAGVSCPSATACVGVGSTNGNGQRPLALVSDGDRWAERATPASPGEVYDASIAGVSCLSLERCVAVGAVILPPSDTQVAVVERWNGRRWTQTAGPAPGNTRDALTGISCVMRFGCVTVGLQQSIGPPKDEWGWLNERWNGHRWIVAPLPKLGNESELYGVSCLSSGSCMAVGSYYGAFAASEYLSHGHWTVHKAPQDAGTSLSSFRAVSCEARNACTAVGWVANRLLADRWNGSRWVKEAPKRVPGAGSSVFTAVACPATRGTGRQRSQGPSSCIAVGWTEHHAGGRASAMSERSDGPRWTLEPMPLPRGAAGSKLMGVSCASAVSCVAVGYWADRAFRRFTLAERWDGAHWSIMPTPNVRGPRSTQLTAVSCRPTGCVAVGYSGDAFIAERLAGGSA